MIVHFAILKSYHKCTQYKLKAVFLITLFFLITTNCFGQKNYDFAIPFSSTNGLPIENCTAVTEDKSGNIWVATQ
jgi:hypothetical protein